MSTTLLFLVPIGVLAVVWSLCFVGCILPTSGLPTPYSNIILQETSLVAYWPLSDLKTSTTAQDLSGNGHTGNYTIPPGYPTNNPQSTPLVPNPPVLNLQQGSIVPGDGFVSGSKNLPFSVDFEGGYVSIPWSTQNSPKLTNFTLEAWVNPHWTEAQSGPFWVVFGAITGNAGFALSVGPTNHWEITIGNGMTTTTVDTMVQVDLGTTTYVAVTFQSTGPTTGMLSLWIDPDSDTSAPPSPAWPTSPNPPPTTYVPVDPTQPVTFFIGAGDNEDAQTLRTQSMGAGAPLYPFLGQIQSVALYSSALQPTDLALHFSDGASSDTDT